MARIHSTRLLAANLFSVLALGVSPLLAEAPPESVPSPEIRVYIGTYSVRGSEGIYVGELNAATGAIEGLRVAGAAKNPSFLAIHPSQEFLFAVSEVDDFDESKGGAVTAFSISPEDGSLTRLNAQSSTGAVPCHVTVDREGKNALVANYGGGSVAVLPIGDDGRLAAASSVVQHEGSGPNVSRQAGPHAHSINLDAANRFAFVADLGLDKVLVYKFDPAKGTLAANDPPFAAAAPGAGPRHFTFHPNGRLAYVINELHSTITAYRYDAKRGALDELQTVSTLPDGVDAAGNSTAEVQVHPSGKFLYGSNRGHDSIASFAIDADSGRLTPTGHQPTGGQTPRNFAIDPSGKFLLAANQQSDTITVHRIDEATGRLATTGKSTSVPSPVCVKMISFGGK